MSRKKRKPNKKKAVEKKNAKEESRRKLIPFTAGKLPSVSKSLPQVASAVPLVSKEIPLVSKPVPLVSAVPNITIPRHLGIMPSKKWGASKVPATRKGGVERPKDTGLLKAVAETIVSPVMGPLKMVEGIASTFKKQAESEMDIKSQLEQELLDLKMRREMGEVSEEDYRVEETELNNRIEDLEDKAKKEKRG